MLVRASLDGHRPAGSLDDFVSVRVEPLDVVAGAVDGSDDLTRQQQGAAARLGERVAGRPQYQPLLLASLRLRCRRRCCCCASTNTTGDTFYINNSAAYNQPNAGAGRAGPREGGTVNDSQRRQGDVCHLVVVGCATMAPIPRPLPPLSPARLYMTHRAGRELDIQWRDLTVLASQVAPFKCYDTQLQP